MAIVVVVEVVDGVVGEEVVDVVGKVLKGERPPAVFLYSARV